MSFLRAHHAGCVLLTAILAGCNDGTGSVAPQVDDVGAQGPSFTVGNAQSTPLARATFSDPGDPVFKVKRITGDWHVEVKAKPALDVAVQSIVFPPNSHSGWHGHPGPVFILVKKGEMTFYESHDPTCTPKLVSAGQGYLDRGDGHIGRNLSGLPAKDITVYFAPPGTTAAQLRIDIPEAEAPKQCGF